MASGPLSFIARTWGSPCRICDLRVSARQSARHELASELTLRSCPVEQQHQQRQQRQLRPWPWPAGGGPGPPHGAPRAPSPARPCLAPAAAPRVLLSESSTRETTGNGATPPSRLRTLRFGLRPFPPQRKIRVGGGVGRRPGASD